MDKLVKGQLPQQLVIIRGDRKILTTLGFKKVYYELISGGFDLKYGRDGYFIYLKVKDEREGIEKEFKVDYRESSIIYGEDLEGEVQNKYRKNTCFRFLFLEMKKWSIRKYPELHRHINREMKKVIGKQIGEGARKLNKFWY